jgi:hypothetical protein
MTEMQTNPITGAVVPPGATGSAAEFLVMSAANALMNSNRVRAVMVIVAFGPADNGTAAPVVMNTWGASNMDQASVLREMAAGLERAAKAEAAGMGPAAPVVQ